jgi:hypothetical protein
MRGLVYSSALAVIAACGSVSDNLPDGGDDDGPADARPDAPITVTVVTDWGDVDPSGAQLPIGLPRPGAEVYFIKPDRTYEMVTSGGTGVATSQPVPDGTSVVVVRPQDPTRFAIIAYLGLAPGTQVTAGPRPDPYVPTSANGTMTINFTPVTGASSYRLTMPCLYSSSQSGNSFTVTLFDPCDHTGRVVLLEALDPNGTPFSFTSTTADVVANSTVMLPAAQPIGSFAANLSGVPPIASEIYINVQRYDAETSLASVSLSGFPTAGALVLAAPSPLAGNRTSIDTRFYDGGFTLQYNRHVVAEPGSIGSYSIDAGGIMPFTTRPMWDPATRTVSWSETGTNRADLGTARGMYYKQGGAIGIELRIVFPHVATTVTLPELPTELAAIAPAAGDNGYINEVFLVDDADVSGYLAGVATADADSRNAGYGPWGDARMAWISGGGFK